MQKVKKKKDSPYPEVIFFTRAELTVFQRSLIVGLSTRTMGIDAKNRLLRKAGSVNNDEPNVTQDLKGKIS